MKRIAVATVSLLLLTGPAEAQIPNLPTFGEDWTDLAFPKVYFGKDGLGVGLYYAQINQLGYDDWDAPQPFRAMVSLDANLTTSGTKRLELALWQRFVINAKAETLLHLLKQGEGLEDSTAATISFCVLPPAGKKEGGVETLEGGQTI